MSALTLNPPDDFQEELIDLIKSPKAVDGEEYKQLEHIYNRLVITNRPNYGPPVQRTLIPAAHARKLGIRLKTAKQLSEREKLSALSARRSKTADPQRSTRQSQHQETVDDNKTHSIYTEQTPRERATTASQERATTAYRVNPSHLGSLTTLYRTGTKSAPANRITSTYQIQREIESPVPNRGAVPAYSSLAMYSPQTQRFTIEQLALEQTRLLKRLSHIQTHRVDKGFYVSGAHFDPRHRYDIDDEHYKLLMEITNKGRHQIKHQRAPPRLSDRILQHFTPDPQYDNAAHSKVRHSQRRTKSNKVSPPFNSLTGHAIVADKSRRDPGKSQDGRRRGGNKSRANMMTPEYDVERGQSSPVQPTIMSNEVGDTHIVDEMETPANHDAAMG